MANLANGRLRVPRSGNAGVVTQRTIYGLPAGTYYWSVQAVDNNFVGSTFAPEASFAMPATPAPLSCHLSSQPTTSSSSRLQERWASATSLMFPMTCHLGRPSLRTFLVM
jgi:hypothetical protein